MVRYNPLKSLRTALNLSQASVAEKIGVSQPNYQRWESGTAPIPEDKLAKVAKVLRTTKDALVAKTRYAHPSLNNEDGDEEDSVYWGEAVIHFTSGSAPVVFSISSAEHRRLLDVLQSPGPAFIEATGLCNEHYVIRREAIAEMYLADESADRYGPEGVNYPGFFVIPIRESRVWDALSCYAEDNLDDVPQGDLAHALSYFMPPEQIAGLLGTSTPPGDVVEGMRTDDSLREVALASLGIVTSGVTRDTPSLEQRKSFLLDRATTTVVRLRDGSERRFALDESEHLEGLLLDLMDLSPEDPGFISISLPDDGQDVFFAATSIDFVRFPALRLERAINEASDPD